MLRHIYLYLSEKYGNESTYKEKQEDANAMAHSVQVQQQHYVSVFIKSDSCSGKFTSHDSSPCLACDLTGSRA